MGKAWYFFKVFVLFFVCFHFPYVQSAAVYFSREQKRRLLVIYVGGTLGMKQNENGSLEPCPGYFAEVVNSMQELQNEHMPYFDIIEFDPILDSASMGPDEWVKIADVVEKEYYNYDGFVVAMGTDTMAYTASALSFMFQDLSKPVILTGSQIPFCEVYNDARRNLIVSMMFAAKKELHEVCIFFNDRLLRGNRATKLNSFGLDAFDSPNFPPLATVGVNIAERKDLLLSPPRTCFQVHKNIDSHIIVIKLVPGFDDEALVEMINHCKNLRAIVLEMYGAGNMKSKKESFIEFIRLAREKRVLVVAATQCVKGSAVLDLYAVGAELLKLGVLAAGDMTTEAVVTKLAYLYGRNNDISFVSDFFPKNLRGEISATETYSVKLSSKEFFGSNL